MVGDRTGRLLVAECSSLGLGRELARALEEVSIWPKGERSADQRRSCPTDSDPVVGASDEKDHWAGETIRR